jgi:DcmR-like sensory protein
VAAETPRLQVGNVDSPARNDLGIGAKQLPRGSHICYLFDDDRERLLVVARFLEAGVRAGEKLIYGVDTMTPEDLRARLAQLSTELAPPHALVAIRSTDIYFRGGRFLPRDMLGLMRSFAEEAVAHGWTGGRGSTEAWRLAARERIERVIDYEIALTSALRSIASRTPFTALCQYDMRSLSGAGIMDLLAVHPYMILRGQIMENPFFVEPDEFSRKRPPSARASPSAG